MIPALIEAETIRATKCLELDAETMRVRVQEYAFGAQLEVVNKGDDPAKHHLEIMVSNGNGGDTSATVGILVGKDTVQIDGRRGGNDQPSWAITSRRDGMIRVELQPANIVATLSPTGEIVINGSSLRELVGVKEK